jgi:hypothetical protein
MITKLINTDFNFSFFIYVTRTYFNKFFHFHFVQTTQLTAERNRQKLRLSKNNGEWKTALAMLPWCGCYLDENDGYPKMTARGE